LANLLSKYIWQAKPNLLLV